MFSNSTNNHLGELNATDIQNTWVHFVITWDAPQQTLKLYHNGEMVHRNVITQTSGIEGGGKFILGQVPS